MVNSYYTQNYRTVGVNMDIFNSIAALLKQALSWVVALLPNSPFKLLDNSPIRDILPYINWFVPFGFIVSTLELWLVAIAGYYLYSVILRWVKAIN